jgi:protein ImuB
MRRVISIWLPTWPLDRIKNRLGLPPEAASAPQVSAISDGATRLIAAVNTAAAARGLYAGMPLAHARVLVAGLGVHAAEPAEDAEALVSLAEWCLRYAPLVAVDAPDGIWIDVTGSAHLHGGEAALLHDLHHCLSDWGFANRLAIADLPAVAHALARFGPDPVTVAPPGDSDIAALPIEGLRLPVDIANRLRLFGFEQIGPLAAAPRAPLTRRFGPLLVARLDQAAGHLFESIQPLVPRTLIQSRRTFVEPLLTAPAFSTVIDHLLADACAELEQASLGARRMDLLFERVDGSQQALRVGTARPVRDTHHLARMLNEKLETVDPGLGVDAMALIITETEALSPAQSTASIATRNVSPERNIALLVDRLTNRLGTRRVYRIAAVPSHVPERSVRRVEPLSPPMAPSSGPSSALWHPDWPRPVRILNPPQPITAMALLPDDPPAIFIWRRKSHVVRYADGPDRIGGEWWKHEREALAIRDYYRVEDDTGRRFWLFRRGNGRDPATGDMSWYLQGFF